MLFLPFLLWVGALISAVGGIAASKKKKEAIEEQAEAREKKPWEDRGGSLGFVVIGGIVLIVAIVVGINAWKSK